MKHPFIMLAFAALVILPTSFAVASDVDDDGISKFTDDSITSYDDLGKPDKNIKYIIVNAKAKAAMAKKGGGSDKTGSTNTDGGDNNVNSVVMGAGSSVRDVYIVAE